MSVSHVTGLSDWVLVRDADADNAAEKDVMKGPCRVLSVSASSGASAGFIKLYDDLNPTVGTDDPDFIISVPASTDIVFMLDTEEGAKFTNGVSLACVTAGGTGGTTSPTNNIAVGLLCKPD